MPITLTAPESASGYYNEGFTAYNVIGLSARHYIITRIIDGVSVQVTGDDAALLATKHRQIFDVAKDVSPELRGMCFASILSRHYVQPALEAEGYIGVGLIDVGTRPVGMSA